MKLWGGRFEKQTAGEVDDFNSSIYFDYRLYKYDILGSIAHAKMLGEQNIIKKADSKIICDGLREILDDIGNGKIQFDIEYEDIHMNIENLLIKRIGDIGKKLHTGRSRNDQVALDIRMYVKEAIRNIIKLLLGLEKELLILAEKHINSIMPGYTHMQKAQPITISHHLLAYFEMFKRDVQRLLDCFKRVDIMPLGSGALAGTTYPLDRYQVAKELGFSGITNNSIDAVSDRDFIIELLSCCSVIMMHLSRFCEEIILWSSDEFKFIELDDAYSTGSSIMPQKKNPDVAELIRGKTGRVYGNLLNILAVMKSLPLAYNKDMQEDKECLFDSIDTIQKCIHIFTNMLDTMTFNTKNMYNQASKGFTNATDAADYLVKKGLPFRAAHEIVGKLVLYCVKSGKSLSDLTIEEYKIFDDTFENDIFYAISLDTCIKKRNIPGGPATEQTIESIKRNKNWIAEIENTEVMKG